MSPGDHLKIYVVFPTFVPNNINKTTITVKASFGIRDSPVNKENMRPNVYNNESYYGSTMAIFKVMADCKNKFNSNHNVLKIFVLRSDISYLT
jgi:hypothetical protein